MKTEKEILKKYMIPGTALHTYREIMYAAMREYAAQFQTNAKPTTNPPLSRLQFEESLSARLQQLPYTKHLDDGQYNDGQVYGFECGAQWAFTHLTGEETPNQVNKNPQ